MVCYHPDQTTQSPFFSLLSVRSSLHLFYLSGSIPTLWSLTTCLFFIHVKNRFLSACFRRSLFPRTNLQGLQCDSRWPRSQYSQNEQVRWAARPKRVWQLYWHPVGLRGSYLKTGVLTKVLYCLGFFDLKCVFLTCSMTAQHYKMLHHERITWFFNGYSWISDGNLFCASKILLQTYCVFL